MPLYENVFNKEINNLLKHPNIVLIDIRDPRDANDPTKLPPQINKILADLRTTIQLNSEELREKHGHSIPNPESLIIGHTRRSTLSHQRSETYLALGYKDLDQYLEKPSYYDDEYYSDEYEDDEFESEYEGDSDESGVEMEDDPSKAIDVSKVRKVSQSIAQTNNKLQQPVGQPIVETDNEAEPQPDAQSIVDTDNEAQPQPDGQSIDDTDNEPQSEEPDGQSIVDTDNEPQSEEPNKPNDV